MNRRIAALWVKVAPVFVVYYPDWPHPVAPICKNRPPLGVLAVKRLIHMLSVGSIGNAGARIELAIRKSSLSARARERVAKSLYSKQRHPPLRFRLPPFLHAVVTLYSLYEQV